MTRSSKKEPFVEERLMERILRMNENNEKRMLKTWSRASVVYPEFVGHTIAVHDGRKHVPVYCTESMVGPKLGGVPPRAPRRGQARARLLHGVDGGPQARRVRPDANLPHPRQERPDRETPVKAVAKFVRIAPRKARLVADEVRGKSVSEAVSILQLTNQRAAGIVGDVIKSAAANAEHNDDADVDALFVRDVRVDEGPTIKRDRARATGGDA